jgi:glycosyltransferase involved in cell wall biosynthesis
MNEYLDGVDVGLYALAVPKHDPVKVHGKRSGAFLHDQLFLKSKSPTKIFEYMAKGIPVVSTRAGEAERVVEQGVTGFLCDSNAQLVDAFVKLAIDADLRKTMGSAARARVEERYRLTHAGEKLEAVFEHALAWRSAAT